MQALLEPLGYRVITASSGEEARSRLLREQVALVLLDVNMPGLNGFETARLIRGVERTRDVPIVFISATDREEATIVRAYARGALDYVTKPVPLDVLLAKVRRYLALQTQFLQERARGQMLASRWGARLPYPGADERPTRPCSAQAEAPARHRW